MLSDTYDYFEKEKEIKQEIDTEFGKTVMSLYSSLFISAYIIHSLLFCFILFFFFQSEEPLVSTCKV